MKQVIVLRDNNTLWPQSTNIHCWWCCHQFTNSPFVLPISYVDNVFNVIGCFCSPECAAAYNFDRHNTDEIWESYSLLNYLYYRIYNENNYSWMRWIIWLSFGLGKKW